MGMSASQARLLSITARITNNEFRAQTITNSKLRLATESEEACNNYMNALESKQLMYMYYDSEGTATKVNMTPAVVYEYSPLKNQYALKNTAGQILVTNQDAQNYENSADLLEFLKCYGLVDSNQTNDFADRMNTYMEEYEQFTKDYQDYKDDHADWVIEKMKYEEDVAAYKEYLNRPNVYQMFNEIVYDNDGNAKDCYKNALNGITGSQCYIHILAHLLVCKDIDNFDSLTDENGVDIKRQFDTSVAGLTVNVEKNNLSGSNIHTNGESENFKDISIQINKEENFCDGDDNFNTEGKQNKLKEIIDSGGTLEGADILKSDYIYDSDTGEYKLKSLKQKAIDLMYMLQHNDDLRLNYVYFTDDDEVKESLRNFTEGDMKALELQEPEPLRTEPTFDKTPPKLEDCLVKVNDKSKAQWYTNLYFMMNGSDTANLVNTINTDNLAADEELGEYRFGVFDMARNLNSTNYVVFEDNLYQSADWLQFGLEHGIITIDRAQYQDPSEDSLKTPQIYADGITWKSIGYTNAADIVSVDNEKAIAIAEVKYKKIITEIENKDKKFDQDLKKLDTERSALQAEYESIKEVISKNVDRSFKAFS